MELQAGKSRGLRIVSPVWCLPVLLAAVLCAGSFKSPSLASRLRRAPLRPARATQHLEQLPLSFEPNRGQVGPGPDFHAVGRGFEALLAKDGTTILLPPPLAANRQSDCRMPNGSALSARSVRHGETIRMRLLHANPDPEVAAVNKLFGKSNYLVGRDPSRWHTDLPNYSQVEYSDVYPGIDLRYHGTQRNLEYDFIVHPGAHPSTIALAFSGEVARDLNSAGDLILKSSNGNVTLHKPAAYQLTHGVRREVEASFQPGRAGSLSFKVAAFDRGAPLIIDPVVTYATYVGGNFAAPFNSMAIDADGNAYITGTANDDFPTTAGAYQATLKGANDVFVTKLNADGTQLIYSTFIGGSSDDAGYAVAIDMSGHAYVTGVTESSDFPVVNTTFGGGSHPEGSHTAFVLELTSDGAGLVYSSYLGGSKSEFANWIAVDPNCSSNCHAYVAGGTQSSDFPATSNAFQPTFAGNNQDAFISKVAVVDGLATLAYSSFLGGPSFAGALAIAVDGSANAYLTGNAGSGYPSTVGAAFGGNQDAFVTKIDTTASGPSSLVYSTYLGGSGRDQGEGIAVPPGCVSACSAYVTGMTSSPDFPITGGVAQPSLAGYEEAYVTQLSPAGAISYSTFLGGVGLDYGQAIAIDSNGDAYVTGYSDSPDLPVIDQLQPIPPPNGKLFEFSSSGTSITETGWPPLHAGSARSFVRDSTTTPNTLYVGTNREGIWKSVNDGVSFTETASKQDTVYALSIDNGLTPQTLFAGTATGLMASSDGGASFALRGTGLPSRVLVYSIIAGPGDLVLLGTNQGVFRSIDGALTFVAATGVPAPTQVYALTSDSGAVYAGTGRGVLISTDGGMSFATTNMNSNTVYAMVDDASSVPPKVYAGTLFGGVLVSSDGFKTNVEGGGISLSPEVVFSLALDPSTSNPATVYAGLSNFVIGAVFESSDGGVNYAQVPSSAPDQDGALKPLDVEGGTAGNNSTIFGGSDEEFYAFLTELNPSASQFLFSSYIGGTTSTIPQGIAIDAADNVFVSGYTASTDFPTTSGVFQTSFGYQGSGFDNAFVEKVAFALPSPTATATPNGAKITAPSSLTLKPVGIGSDKASTAKLMVKNSGKGGDLIGTVASQTNPLFTLSANSFDIAPGKVEAIDVTCMPDNLVDQGVLTLNSNASNSSTLDVALDCTGLSGKLSVPKTLVLRSGGVGQAVTANLVVKNVGKGVLTLTSDAATPAPLFQGGGQSVGVQPGATADIAISFTPAQKGIVTGSIELNATPPSHGGVTVKLKGITK
jgi:beta-propeller repeat-containing protein